MRWLVKRQSSPARTRAIQSNELTRMRKLWETVWAKNGDEEDAFSPWPVEGTHRPTFCVWELGAAWHEQQTWSEYLRAERDEAAKQAYLQDAYTGAV